MSYKDSIIGTAMALFAENGFKDTSTADIAKSIGSAESTLFHHFKNKEELLLKILERVQRDIVREVESHLHDAEPENGLAMISGIVGLFFHLSEAKRVEFLLLFRNYPYQLANVNPTCRKIIESIYDFFLGIIAEALIKGQQDGSIREVNVQKQAMVILAMITGLTRFDIFGIMTLAGYHQEIIDSCQRMLCREYICED
ncbi:MAG: TetR/AcrR family transcriptional regulator [Deltaproteobacteria bacterium]|nr:TetR/AcrR family transcriptional regulator [Deltaproteobacteria bacterium]